MFCSALVVALLGFVEPGSSHEPTWISDYSSALKLAKEQRKPLAVFIGKGKDGWKHLSRNGMLTDEALRVLNSDYTCLFVDSKKPTGKELAEAFAIKDGLGIVISDRTGDRQAFYHAGDLDDGALLGYLKRFADPNLVVRTTITNPSEEAQAGADQPAQYYYRPVYRMSFGGGC
jgi:hypothetical protein